jgi:putative thioredoxin
VVDDIENMRIAGKHKVCGFPAVVAYSHGVGIDRFHSARTDGSFRGCIDRVIAQYAEVLAKK